MYTRYEVFVVAAKEQEMTECLIFLSFVSNHETCQPRLMQVLFGAFLHITLLFYQPPLHYDVILRMYQLRTEYKVPPLPSAESTKYPPHHTPAYHTTPSTTPHQRDSPCELPSGARGLDRGSQSPAIRRVQPSSTYQSTKYIHTL